MNQRARVRSLSDLVDSRLPEAWVSRVLHVVLDREVLPIQDEEVLQGPRTDDLYSYIRRSLVNKYAPDKMNELNRYQYSEYGKFLEINKYIKVDISKNKVRFSYKGENND